MLYKTVLITYALGLAGLGDAAPVLARDMTATGACTTQNDCSGDTHCLRASTEDLYQCMTLDAFEAVQPDAAVRQMARRQLHNHNFMESIERRRASTEYQSLNEEGKRQDQCAYVAAAGGHCGLLAGSLWESGLVERSPKELAAHVDTMRHAKEQKRQLDCPAVLAGGFCGPLLGGATPEDLAPITADKVNGNENKKRQLDCPAILGGGNCGPLLGGATP